MKTEFENLLMKETETLDEFALRLSGLVTNMRALGETVEEGCKGYGHFAVECRKPKKERDSKLEANLVQVQDDEPALLFIETDEKKLSALLLTKRKIMPKLNTSKWEKSWSNVWYLDNDASNHMMGELGKFKELDYKVTRKVKFGDGSTVEIKGKGVVYSVQIVMNVVLIEWVISEVATDKNELVTVQIEMERVIQIEGVIQIERVVQIEQDVTF
ncbi:hypothetical protein AgCh_019698 [Apium graveolens]